MDRKANNESWPDISRPDDFARLSPRVRLAEHHLRCCAGHIRNRKSAMVIAAMHAPLHTAGGQFLLSRNRTVRRKAPELCEKLLQPLSYEAWWGAPAAALSSHHPYPGGWLLHNATNLHVLEQLLQTSYLLRKVEIEVDDLYAGMLLHDVIKPRLLLWNDGCLDSKLGDLHHVAAIAEAYLQGAPERVLIMLSGVHSGWWHNRDIVVGYFQQAAELVGESTLERIAQNTAHWDMHVETELMYQAECAWYSSTRQAFQAIKQPLAEFLTSLVPSQKHQAALWWIHLHCDELELARRLGEGREAFADTIRQILRV